MTGKNPHESIARGSLTGEAKLWFYFVSSVLLPSKHLNKVRKNEAILLYALLKGYKINVGKIIENSIMSYYKQIQGLDSTPSYNHHTLPFEGEYMEIGKTKKHAPRLLL